MIENIYNVVGLMSGTSLDGLDMALCSFKKTAGIWSFELLKSTTIEYSFYWKERLSLAQNLNAAEFIRLHRDFGAFMGKEVKKFIEGIKTVNFVASHGHTVFHKPEESITFQIGCGAYLAANCNINVISDFRTLDIAKGGQGAPLVPIGDKLLFSEYDACINLGGFANISFDNAENKRVAFDISPVNIVLNNLTKIHFDKPYDSNGEIGRNSMPNNDLLNLLNEIAFYNTEGPKSLGREWVETVFDPILDQFNNLAPENIMATCYHHFAYQIAKTINNNNLQNTLFTGGGAFNSFLMELVNKATNAKVTIPDAKIIEFKEAIIFAFLGVLRMEGISNCLSSVTGASSDNIGGAIYIA